jgi:hypothetical protein
MDIFPRLLSWMDSCYIAADSGVDGLVIEVEDESIFVHYFQIKTGKIFLQSPNKCSGREDKLITLGGPKDEEKGHDTTLKGILTKARVGVVNLQKFLKTRGEEIISKSFTLVTFKTLNADARNFLKAPIKFGKDSVTVRVLEQKETLQNLIGESILQSIGLEHLVK